jgi:hypothetical protein
VTAKSEIRFVLPGEVSRLKVRARARINESMARRKNPAAVALSALGAAKGGHARAAKLTPEQRSASARKAVQARWAKIKNGSDYIVPKNKKMGVQEFSESRKGTRKSAPAAPVFDTSKKALHLCLKRLKSAQDQSEIERLTEELQRIVFDKQYQNAEN